MGFEFGVITSLNFNITLYCFIAVVSFVILFEYLIGIMEYFLEGSHLYSHMIQMIYKELMLMGLVTFCVIMYEATPTGGISETEEDWINAIDFSHVYLFFVTFFFVMHAFYLMFMSVWSSSSYRSMFTEKTVDLMAVLNKVKSNWWDKFLFNVKALPLCSVRNRVEFSMIHSLFVKTYLLPVDFDFPYYLSGCFDRFALKTINRSMFTWIVLLVIVAFNFLRILVGLSCAVPSEEEAEERRRFLQETDESEVEDSGHDHCKEEVPFLIFLVRIEVNTCYAQLLACFLFFSPNLLFSPSSDSVHFPVLRPGLDCLHAYPHDGVASLQDAPGGPRVPEPRQDRGLHRPAEEQARPAQAPRSSRR